MKARYIMKEIKLYFRRRSFEIKIIKHKYKLECILKVSKEIINLCFTGRKK